MLIRLYHERWEIESAYLALRHTMLAGHVLRSGEANIAVRRYVPQATLLPHCHAAVIHGGAGTMLGALAAGVPLLCLPQGADQHGNAERVVAAGAGLTLLRDELTPATVREAIAAPLNEPSYRRAAQRIADEIAAMPTAVEALAAIMGSIT